MNSSLAGAQPAGSQETLPRNSRGPGFRERSNERVIAMSRSYCRWFMLAFKYAQMRTNGPERGIATGGLLAGGCNHDARRSRGSSVLRLGGEPASAFIAIRLDVTALTRPRANLAARILGSDDGTGLAFVSERGARTVALLSAPECDHNATSAHQNFAMKEQINDLGHFN